MKTDYNKQTKYFKQYYNLYTHKFDFEEIHLNRDNWFYVQVDGTIRTIFSKYNLPFPKYVIVIERLHLITFKVFRENLNTIEDLQKWDENWIFICDELTRQAKSNSKEDEDNWIKYEFKFL